jgi:hypothetical protein
MQVWQSPMPQNKQIPVPKVLGQRHPKFLNISNNYEGFLGNLGNYV